MLTNPFTGMLLNVDVPNPQGCNQHTGPDCERKSYQLAKHVQTPSNESDIAKKTLEYWDKDPEFAAIAMKARHLVTPGAPSEKRLKSLVKAIKAERKFRRAGQKLFGDN